MLLYIKHISPGQSKPSQNEQIIPALVGSGRSLQVSVLAGFLNKGRHHLLPQ